MKLLVLGVLMFFLIDLKYYKPPEFIHHKMAVSVLFCHHWLIMTVLLGWIYFPVWLYGGLAAVILVGWGIFENRCILSAWTIDLGPTGYQYSPYMGPMHHALGLHESSIKQYWGKKDKKKTRPKRKLKKISLLNES